MILNNHGECAWRFFVWQDTGALATWGAAEFGQLGQNESVGLMNVAHPRMLKGSRELHFVRAACGATHTLALTGSMMHLLSTFRWCPTTIFCLQFFFLTAGSGSVYSFGQGTFGALGHGNTESYNVPTFIEDLWGFGIVQVIFFICDLKFLLILVCLVELFGILPFC